jgi:hypothetical protein
MSLGTCAEGGAAGISWLRLTWRYALGVSDRQVITYFQKRNKIAVAQPSISPRDNMRSLRAASLSVHAKWAPVPVLKLLCIDLA